MGSKRDVLGLGLRACAHLRARWNANRDPAHDASVRIGADCRLLGLAPRTFGSEPYLVTLGDHVTVTSGVRFVTHDGGVWVFRREHPDIDIIGRITVGNNVFIGLNAIIMPGVTIGGDSVIGAGSVVTHDVPPGTVAAGVPARPIKTIQQYRESLDGRALHIRSLDPDEKRRYLERHVPMENA